MDSSIDRTQARVIAICFDGTVLQLNEIEQINVTKSDTGDAGEFTISLALGLNLPAAVKLQPMDYIAIFVGRNSTSTGGSKAAGTNSDPFPALGPSNVQGLTYGAEGAQITKTLGAFSSCLMIGMLDVVHETQTFQGQPTATLELRGRDLTKIFLDNDTFVQYSIPASDPNNDNGVASLLQIPLRTATSGTRLLLDILNVFCKKNPPSIIPYSGAGGAQAVNTAGYLTGDALAQVQAYGYNWDRFISTAHLDINFVSLSSDFFPTYSVQSGSVWANCLELRNFPVCRLYVDELGNLIYDDQYTVWTNPAIAGTIEAADVRSSEFWQTDEDLLTAITVIPALANCAVSEIAALLSTARSRVPVDKDTIQRFGYRWTSFVSQYDSVKAFQTLDKRFKALWLLHNTLTRGRVIVKGDAKFRVGQRYQLNFGGANAATQFRSWYVTNTDHNYQFGSDYTTTLELRYPLPVAK